MFKVSRVIIAMLLAMVIAAIGSEAFSTLPQREALQPIYYEDGPVGPGPIGPGPIRPIRPDGPIRPVEPVEPFYPVDPKPAERIPIDRQTNLARPIATNSGTGPGIQSGISTRAIQKLINKVLPPVLNIVKTTKYPDVASEQKKQKAYVYHPTFDALSVGAFVAQVNGGQFTVGIRDFHLDLKAGWRVKVRKLRIWISTSGNVQVRFSASRVLASFGFGTKTVGSALKPTAVVNNVEVDVTAARVKLSKNIFAWLFNLVTSFFKNKIRSLVNTAVRDAVRNGLTAAASRMTDAIPSSASLGALGSINLALTSGMRLLNNDVIAVPFDGRITSKTGVVGNGARHNVPFTPTGRMLDVVVDTFVINSGAEAAFQSNNFNYVYSDANARPAGLTSDLRGSTLDLPALNNAGHGNKLLRVRAVPASALFVTSSPNNLQASKSMDIAFDINLGNGNFLEVVVIRAVGSGGVNVSFQNINGVPHLVPRVNNLNATFTQVRGAFGQITFNKLNTFLSQVLNGMIVPSINTLVLQPMPIPTTAGLALTNPAINFKQDHIYAGFDVDFNI